LQRRHPRVAQTLGVIGVGRVVHDLPTLPIEAVEATILRADPEDTVLVFVHGPDMIAGQARGRLRVGPREGKRLTQRCIDIYAAAVCADPEQAGPICGDVCDIIVAQTRGDGRIMPIRREGLSYGVKHAQSPTEGANPERAGGVLNEAIDPIAAQTVWVVRIV